MTRSLVHSWMYVHKKSKEDMKALSKILSISFVMGLLAVFGVAGFTSHEASKPDLHALSGIVEYMSEKSPLKQVSHGSGVFISKDQVLTAAHVVDFGLSNEKLKLRVRLPDGDLYSVKKIDNSKNFDMAVLTLDRPYRGEHNFPKLACDNTVPGEMYRTIGSPLSVEYLDAEIRATGGRPDFLYGVQQNEYRNGPSVSLYEEQAQDKVELNPKYKVIPPDELPNDPSKPAPELDKKQETKKQGRPVNVSGATFFQGPALPGQSGSPVYDKHGNIRGVVIITLYDSDKTSYSGLGMYIDSPAVCKFVNDDLKN